MVCARARALCACGAARPSSGSARCGGAGRRWLAILVSVTLTSPAIPAHASRDRSGVEELESAVPGLDATELGIIVNDADPLSVRIADYYRVRRGIPAANVVHVRLPAGAVLPARQFARIKRAVDTRTPARVQAYALAWTEPYRVACMSVTSAFAYGFDQRFCAQSCRDTPVSPYFNSKSRRPYHDYHMRPAMLLAARDFAQAKALIDRGVAADGSLPFGTAYLLDTSDKLRDVRASTYAFASLFTSLRIRVQILRADALHNRSDVLFYFTGLPRVADLNSLHFVPGAIADHLTSFGGELMGSPQMSSLEWLEAGATGSYGTVVEPCNYPAKFPSVPIVMQRYLAGETLIEAYWKSVAEPSQGVFIGEPLARPFGSSTRSGSWKRSASRDDPPHRPVIHSNLQASQKRQRLLPPTCALVPSFTRTAPEYQPVGVLATKLQLASPECPRDLLSRKQPITVVKFRPQERIHRFAVSPRLVEDRAGRRLPSGGIVIERIQGRKEIIDQSGQRCRHVIHMPPGVDDRGSFQHERPVRALGQYSVKAKLAVRHRRPRNPRHFHELCNVGLGHSIGGVIGRQPILDVEVVRPGVPAQELSGFCNRGRIDQIPRESQAPNVPGSEKLRHAEWT